MSVFNSLGSNYDLKFALRCLFAGGDIGASETLKKVLHDRYGGQVELYYKGREALSEAVRLATEGEGTVLINGFTCYAVYEAVAATGAKAIYADINAQSLHFRLSQVKKAHKKHRDLKAIIVQNTLGVGSDVDAIAKYCRQNDIILIEDLAHSFGTRYLDGVEAGKKGDFVMLSFGRDKVIDAVSGGALVVRNQKYQAETAERSPGFIAQVIDRKYPINTWLVRKLYSIKIGLVFQWIGVKIGFLPRSVDGDWVKPHQLPHWQANLVLYQLDRHEVTQTHRDRIADIYSSTLARELGIPEQARNTNHNSNLRFPVYVEDREGLFAQLKKNGIYVADTWYDVTIAPPRWLGKTNYQAGECKVAEQHAKQIINLPTHINVSERQAHKIAEKVLQWHTSK